MRMPTAYDDDIFNVLNGFDAEGLKPPAIVYSIVYPPVGFFPFAETGNGDYHGLYWPIGQEEADPLVAYSSHDAYALIPEYGDLISAGKCQLACSEDRKLTYQFVAVFAATNMTRPFIDIPDALSVDNHRQLLLLDPNSPFRNCALADQLIAENDFASAEKHYRRAIELLPEYGAAHFGLGYLLRRTRHPALASISLRKSLMCPLAFWGGCFWADHILPGSFRNDWARKALLWLQQTKQPDESIRDDPFIRNIHDLSLKTGVAETRDLELAMQMVDTYCKHQQFLDAIYLWINTGDRAACETTSFRERHGFTARFFGGRLIELYQIAGMHRRAKLLQHMLSLMKKPNGRYL